MSYRKKKPVLSRIFLLENRSIKNGLRHSVFTPCGRQYRGEWHEGQRAGLGALIYENNELYEGTWKRNQKHGWGRVSEMDGDTRMLTYSGEMRYGKRNGFGFEHSKDGSYYEGHFKNDQRWGYGRCWYKDNSFYSGHWKKNVPDGEGMLILDNGNRYEGEWQEGEKNGYGSYYFLKKGKLLRGHWCNNIPITSSIIDLPSNSSTAISLPSLMLNENTDCLQVLKAIETKLSDMEL